MEATAPEKDIVPAGKSSAEITHAERIVVDAVKSEAPALTRAQIRRFTVACDLRVLPMLGVIYAVSILDRINIGSAKVLGMDEDLNLGDGTRYSIILMLFFPSYFLTDVPSNFILTRVPPHLWLSFLMFAWGAVLTGMAFTNSWQVMAFLRFLLGAFEGGVLPGVTFCIACWYTRQELHKRIACAYGLGLISSAFAGIISYGLGQMDGIRGMKGWRWIFSIEGGATMLLALVATVTLPSFPDQAKWPNPEQRLYLYQKLQRDHGQHEQEKAHWKTLKHVASDWVFWLQGSFYCFNVGTANAVGFFSPTIIQGLGYDGLQASLRSGFPFFAALGLLGIVSTISDRYQLRATLSVFTTILMIIGLVLMSESAGFGDQVRYLGIFFLTMGVHCNVPAMLAFNQSNTLGAANRAMSSGLLIACGAIGGIIGSLIFRGEDAPGYAPGLYTTMGFCVWNVFALVVLVVVFKGRNRRIQEGEIVQGAPDGYRFSL